MSDLTDNVNRRRFLTGAVGVGAGVALTACTSNSAPKADASSTSSGSSAPLIPPCPSTRSGSAPT